MVSVAGTQNRHGGTSPVKAARTEAEGHVSPGKSGQSVGHLAKAAIEMRLEQGEELAPNALGKAAAAIAKMTFEKRTALLAPAADPEPDARPGHRTGQHTRPGCRRYAACRGCRRDASPRIDGGARGDGDAASRSCDRSGSDAPRTATPGHRRGQPAGLTPTLSSGRKARAAPRRRSGWPQSARQKARRPCVRNARHTAGTASRAASSGS